MMTGDQAIEEVCIHVGMALHEAETLLITATLRHTHGNMRAAAAVLKINRATLYNKVKRYGILRSQTAHQPRVGMTTSRTRPDLGRQRAQKPIANKDGSNERTEPGT